MKNDQTLTDRRSTDSMDREEEHEKDEKDLEVDELESHCEPESPIDRAPNEEDLEKGVPSGKKDDVTLENTSDPFLVIWEGPDDPENPKNWKFSRKWAAVGIISAFTFMTPVSSSMIAPALPAMSKELGIKTELTAVMSLSIFLLAYAIGPLILGPLSEVYGRARVMQCANLFYLVWNFACGWAYTIPEIMAFRFLAGLGGSAPLAIGGGVMGDLFHAEDRGKALALFTMGPLLGPAVGPIAGGWIAEKTTWRWVFWSCTILTVIIQGLGLVYLQETFAPVLLQRRAAVLREQTGNNSYYTEWDSPDRTPIQVIQRALKRPFRFLTTEPIIQAIAGSYLWISTFAKYS
jgi:multidrug resistance protein